MAIALLLVMVEIQDTRRALKYVIGLNTYYQNSVQKSVLPSFLLSGVRASVW